MRKVALVALVVVAAMPAVAQETSTIDVERTPDVTAWEQVAKAAASSGLDFHWNDDYSTYSIFMSFLGADNAVHVLRLKNFSWYDTVVQSDFSGSSAYPPKISAQGDTVIVTYTHTFAYGRGVKYMISYDAGDSWASGAIATPADGEGPYCRHDVSARGGIGILSAQQQELGFVDAMYYRYRPSYVDPVWNDQETFNDWEVATGGEVEVNFLGPEVGFGVAYVTDDIDLIPYFDRLHPDQIFGDGFEVGDLSRWSSSAAKAVQIQSPYGDILPIEDAVPSASAEAPQSVWEFLDRLSTSERARARIEIEHSNSESDEKAEIAELWDAGNYDGAIGRVRELESGQQIVGVGLSWITPKPSAKSFGTSDIRIGTRTGAQEIVLDYEAASGNLFAVVRWPTSWSLHLSTDGGRSWSETYVWAGSVASPPVRIGGAAMGADMYVGYVVSDGAGDLGDARIRRFRASDGNVDSVYGFRTVDDVSPAAISEIVLGSNADDLDNVVYYALLTDNGKIRLLYSYGDTFYNLSPSICDDALDTDGDRLLNCYETNTGVFINDEDTGTDPNVADTDGDYINDGDEVLGTLGGLDLPGMGASPVKKNILIEYDWFSDSIYCGAHDHRPSGYAISLVTEAFASAPVSNPDGSSGIAVIHDYGQGGAFTGGNLVPDADGVIAGDMNGADFLAIKAANFDANRAGYFHYVLLPHQFNTDSSYSGVGEYLGDDFIVSLQCNYYDAFVVAGTIMHELGHNLGLEHGGDTPCNWKPNYNSIMNYKYQFVGVDDDCDSQGDRVLDYSVGDRLTLVESSLNENNGVCGAGNPIDWDGDTVLESSISFNVNGRMSNGMAYDGEVSECGGTITTLTDYSDWDHIVFTGLSDPDKQAPEIIVCTNTPPHREDSGLLERP